MKEQSEPPLNIVAAVAALRQEEAKLWLNLVGVISPPSLGGNGRSTPERHFAILRRKLLPNGSRSGSSDQI